MIKIVPDTMVLVQGLLSNNNDPRKLINLALAGRVILYGSSGTYAELRSTIRKPDILRMAKDKRMSPEYLENAYNNVIQLVEPVGVYEGISICSDPDDDIFVRVAKFKESKIVVSRDKHLLRLKEYDGIKILRPDVFIEIFLKINDGKLYR